MTSGHDNTFRTGIIISTFGLIAIAGIVYASFWFTDRCDKVKYSVSGTVVSTDRQEAVCSYHSVPVFNGTQMTVRPDYQCQPGNLTVTLNSGDDFETVEVSLSEFDQAHEGEHLELTRSKTECD